VIETFEMEMIVADTYENRLSVAFTDYVSRYEKGTGKPVRGILFEALAANYALEAAKDVTATIMENSKKLDPKTTRPIEFDLSKHRIESAWKEMTVEYATSPFQDFKDGLFKLLKELSTPSEAELTCSEVVGDTKMIFRTADDYRGILRFLGSCI
jgi:hypothetical protein